MNRSLLEFAIAFLAVFVMGNLIHAVELRPNILFILTDDQRWDAIQSSGNRLIETPNLDRLAQNGVRFENAFVTLSICSPSRAACLTGRYGSANGVTSVGNVSIKPNEPVFAKALKESGYATGVTGKWHIKNSPNECGFDFVSTCWSNGTWYDREFVIDGERKKMPGFVDDVVADESIKFIRQSVSEKRPFLLWMCTQVPHMDNRHTWPAEQHYLDRYKAEDMPLPETWNDDLHGKPKYLKTSRNREQAMSYGYAKPESIREHTRNYYASVQQMDAAIGRVIRELDALNLRDNTWIFFMSDNGWMLGEHGMTSKVLAYEESMRVPMAIAGPGLTPDVKSEIVLNIDLTATIYALAGLPIPKSLHGCNLLPLLKENRVEWRNAFLYEAPTPQLGSKPLWAVRDNRWKYIETRLSQAPNDIFRELYDLDADRIEVKNLADSVEHREILERLKSQLKQLRTEIQTNK